MSGPPGGAGRLGSCAFTVTPLISASRFQENRTPSLVQRCCVWRQKESRPFQGKSNMSSRLTRLTNLVDFRSFPFVVRKVPTVSAAAEGRVQRRSRGEGCCAAHRHRPPRHRRRPPADHRVAGHKIHVFMILSTSKPSEMSLFSL